MAERVTKLSEVDTTGRLKAIEDIVCEAIDHIEDNTKGVFIFMTPDRSTYTYNYCGMDRIEFVGLLEAIKVRELI